MKPTTDNPSRTTQPPLPVSFFYGWVVVALTFGAILVAAGIRAAPQTFIKPLEADFGWGRAAIASAVAINLVLYGAIGPIGGWIQDRYGARIVMLTALALLSGGVAATTVMTELWHFILIWGFVVGIGAGGMSSVLAATVANRWFVKHRGLVLGLLNAGGSTGQLIFIPVVMAIIVMSGWRTASVVLAAAGTVSFVLVWWLMRSDPSDIGDEALGESAANAAIASSLPEGSTPTVTTTRMADAVKSRTFWLLCGAYFICGVTSNGLIGTHMIPHALDIGISEGAAAFTVGIMGFMNLFGTLMAGWLSDRMDTRKLLAAVYALRAVSLFILPVVADAMGLFIFGIIYGHDWFATVPPIVAIAGEKFGKRSVGTIYGWVFLSHQLGGAMAAVGGGLVFEWLGDYNPAFIIGGVLALVAVAMSMGIEKKQPLEPSPLGHPRLATT